jgi:hypothetical protein
MLVVAAIVDQKWLKRLEQQLSGLVETSSTVPLLAHDASQFLEDEICRRRPRRRAARFAQVRRPAANVLPAKARAEISVTSRRSFRRPPFSVYPNPALRLDTAAAVKTLLSVWKLADGCPRTVRIAARGAARSLRLAVNIDGVGKGTTLAVGLLVGGTRNNGAITPRIGVSPGNRGSRLAALEGVHLRRIGALLVFVVQRRADTIAYQAAENATNRRASESVSGPATCDRGPKERSGTCTDHSSGTLPRPWSGHWSWSWS